MGLRLTDVEVFGVTESSITVAYAVEGEDRPCVRVTVDGRVAGETRGPGLHLVRVEDLEPERDYRVGLDAAGAAAPATDELFFPATVTTLAAAAAPAVATLATLSDLHFGEDSFGGIAGVADDVLPASYTPEPYWQFMNHDAVADINRARVSAVVIKGDIADHGTGEQFAHARATFDRLEAPWHAFLGNHDAYGGAAGDGYRILDQPPPPRGLELAGWRLIFVDTVAPAEDRGRLAADQLDWLDAELAAHAEPALIFMHHQPVPPAHAGSLINRIGVAPEDSASFIEILGRHPQARGVLIGHTHRNRVRRYPEARHIPFAEVGCTKDYPGVWGHYTLHADGSFRQEVRRTSSRRALTHSQRCGRMFDGRYRRFAIGRLADRCFAT